MVSTGSMIQGLNLIQRASPTPPSDSQDLLPESPHFSSDLEAQLFLWSTVDFASNEPDRETDPNEYDVRHYDDTDEADAKPTPNEAGGRGEGVTELTIDPATLITTQTDKNDDNSNSQTSKLSSDHHHPHNSTGLDYFQFLAGLGIDPFQDPTVLNNAVGAGASAGNFPNIFASSTRSLPPGVANRAVIIDPALAALSSPSNHLASSPTSSSPYTTHTIPNSNTSEQPSSKKPRVSGASVSSSSTASSPTAHSPNLTTPLTPTEDKRRRNTAASARFRAKKKERELAMDKHAKELEGKVSNLERECESLRRENGWLRGLVVGVAGGVGGLGAVGLPGGMDAEVQAKLRSQDQQQIPQRDKGTSLNTASNVNAGKRTRETIEDDA
ncbi:uncharacterized protein EI90DRAFT_3069861 [Cantharellus anzutake]|uniref:uncharacterized protein n=1 Tax=Cantharellus anzutake TaxID=1750568 RepID=UPI0019065201|nr:uncharacterized protein EI90DRAFT_3069861 [Cantharellus anzutake]KAF8326590.1 hypothetical protein EI90DRAFT_3069861 [Cantharellus anzutake]